jgi:hypothetical protein
MSHKRHNNNNNHIRQKSYYILRIFLCYSLYHYLIQSKIDSIFILVIKEKAKITRIFSYRSNP